MEGVPRTGSVLAVSVGMRGPEFHCWAPRAQPPWLPAPMWKALASHLCTNSLVTVTVRALLCARDSAGHCGGESTEICSSRAHRLGRAWVMLGRQQGHV